MLACMLMSLLMADDPKPFESKREKDAAIAAVQAKMEPIATKLNERLEDLAVSKKAFIDGKKSQDKNIGKGRESRVQWISFRNEAEKREALADISAQIKDLRTALKPYEEQIAAIKKRPVVPPKPAEKKDG